MLITALDPTLRSTRRTFVGELDIATEPLVSDSLREALHRVPRSLQVDFSGVSFMDCSGVRVLLGALRQAQEAQVRFGLVGRSPAVQRVLELTDVAPLFPDVPRLVTG